MASLRRDQELPCTGHSHLQLAPTDPPLAKAEPIGDAAGTSVVTHLTKGKKCCAAAVKRLVKKCERSSPAVTQVREGGGAPGAGAEIALAAH